LIFLIQAALEGECPECGLKNWSTTFSSQSRKRRIPQPKRLTTVSYSRILRIPSGNPWSPSKQVCRSRAHFAKGCKSLKDYRLYAVGANATRITKNSPRLMTACSGLHLGFFTRLVDLWW